MKLTFSRLVVALSAPMLGIKNVEVLAKFTLPAEDEPHEAVWLQVSFTITSQLIAESILISFDDSKCVAISVAP